MPKQCKLPRSDYGSPGKFENEKKTFFLKMFRLLNSNSSILSPSIT